MEIFDNLIWKFFSKRVKNILKNRVGQLPIYEFEERHLINTQCITNRDELLNKITKGSNVIELGVDRGQFSERILDIIEPTELHLVDLWNSTSKRYGSNEEAETRERIKNHSLNNRVTIHKGLSTDVVTKFKDHYFDLVYIDTDHSYKTTRMELELYSNKIKPGGILAGHDFIHYSKGRISKFGVYEAVVEFCHNHNFELAYLTMENKLNPSFALRKI